MVFCPRRIRRGYEPIWDSGEDMRLKNQRWLIHSSSLNWRGYESELAKLWILRNLADQGCGKLRG